LLDRMLLHANSEVQYKNGGDETRVHSSSSHGLLSPLFSSHPLFLPRYINNKHTHSSTWRKRCADCSPCTLIVADKYRSTDRFSVRVACCQEGATRQRERGNTSWRCNRRTTSLTPNGQIHQVIQLWGAR
jgi:hypothetical protein